MKKLPRSKKVLEYALVSISALKSGVGGAWVILMSTPGPFPWREKCFLTCVAKLSGTYGPDLELDNWTAQWMMDFDVLPDNFCLKEPRNIDTDTSPNDGQQYLDEVFAQVFDIFLTILVWVVDGSTSKIIFEIFKIFRLICFLWICKYLTKIQILINIWRFVSFTRSFQIWSSI